MIESQPLVLNITNSVTVDFVANALLAFRASPVMSEDIEDTLDLASLSGSICINIGTINPSQEDLIFALLAKVTDKPIVLDPVGCGASKKRTEVSQKIIDTGKISLIRGNASEISALSGNLGSTRGVDSTQSSLNVKDSAILLARSLKSIVVVSGEVDLATDGNKLARIYNGSVMMTKITGCGCVMSSFLAAVMGDGKKTMEDIARAVAFYGYLGEFAEKLVAGTGSYKVNLLDAFSQIKFKDVSDSLKYDIGDL